MPNGKKNFSPIVVDDTCSVRAPFHEQPNTVYDIVIEPKMSFGTGHHENDAYDDTVPTKKQSREQIGFGYGLWNRRFGDSCRNEGCKSY